MSRQLILLYQYFHPDEVISARLYADLAEEMTRAGWQVIAMPASRECHSSRSLPLREQWAGGSIQRVWRPGFKQSSFLGRILNALCMLLGWSWRAATHQRSDREVVIIGTDPILGVLAAIPWRLWRRSSQVIHWCHDLHPEAIIADGGLRQGSWLERLIRLPLRQAYGCTDQLVDLGSCMRERLKAALPARPLAYQHQTITPWALIEPAEAGAAVESVHRQLFGSAPLGLLYSGNLGRAHEFEPFLELARHLERTEPGQVALCFAGRGARFAELRSALLPSDQQIHLADFAQEEQLQARLSAGDVHMVSLREAWTGTVVPSKFFGALAIGRPILFVGGHDSAIAQWIAQYEIGWHLTAQSIDHVAEQLLNLARDPIRRCQLNQHCFEVYHQHFSKEKMLIQWHQLLGTDA